MLRARLAQDSSYVRIYHDDRYLSVLNLFFYTVSTMWYTKSELPLRLGIWYSATGLFTIFAGVINYAIGHIHGALSPWKYMYLVAGAITIAWAFVVLLLLPDSPAAASSFTLSRMFSAREREILVHRMKGNVKGADVRRVKMYQVRPIFVPVMRCKLILARNRSRKR